MSTFRITIASLALAALASMPTASAQQRAPGQPDEPAQAGTQSPEAQAEQSDRYEARRISPDSQQQGPMTVSQAILQKLQKANEAEVELAKLAQQKTDNPEVRQLTQTIIQDHQALNQKLQQFAQQRQASQSGLNRDASQSTAQSRSAPSQSATVPPELCQVAERACENALQMTKTMLGNYQGQDFNMAFLGQQCVAHTMMLAELKAIESVGPEELKAIAQQAAAKVETHLQQTKQLAKKFEDDRKSQQ